MSFSTHGTSSTLSPSPRSVVHSERRASGSSAIVSFGRPRYVIIPNGDCVVLGPDRESFCSDCAAGTEHSWHLIVASSVSVASFWSSVKLHLLHSVSA